MDVRREERLVPSVSKKQHNFMAAVAKNPKFAKKVGVPRSVGEEFLTADKGRKFKEGGEMKESKAMAKKEVAFMQKKGAPKSMIKHEKEEYGLKKGGKAKGYSAGGYTRAADGITQRGKTKGKQVAMRKGGKC